MALDPDYIEQIRKSEGYAETPFWDYKQSTSGYGTKAQPGDDTIPPDQLKAVYEQRYQDELAKAAAHVDSVNPNLPPGVKAALTSLTYNAGPGWSQSGLGEAIKAGDYDKARDIFLQYNKAGGEVNPGLVARRQREAAWFGGTPQQTAPASPAGPPSTPLNIAPQAPIFAPPAQAAQSQAAPQDAGLFQQIPPMQQAPIFYAQRRSPDLSKLRASFKAPVFSRMS